MGTLRNYAKGLWRWEPDRRYNFFSPPAHLCRHIYLDLLQILSIGRDGQLHTSIYDKRDDFNFHITNFPFLSSNIPTSPAYGVFISQLYGMPGLAPRIDVLSWGRRDFQISFSNRDTSRNAWNRHWGSFMVDTGILSNNMKFPFHKC